MSDITLEWHGPYEFTSKRGRSPFAAPVAEEPGIYLWAVETETSYLIHYVGETGASFGSRHYEHFREYSSGAYTIHRAESFAAGRRDPVYKGFAYAGERWRRAQPFIDGFAEYAAELARMLDAIMVFAAPLHAEQGARRRVEGPLMRALYGGDSGVRAFQEEKMRAWTRRPDEEPLCVASRSDAKLRGLPGTFEA